MTAVNSYSTGTVSVSNGDTAIVGSGTIWSGTNARGGDIIIVDGLPPVEIEDVTDTTHVTLWEPWAGGNKSAVSYRIIQKSPLRFAGGDAMRDVNTLIAALNTNGFYVFVDPSLSVPDPSLGDDGQYAFQGTTGKLWQKTGGAWNFIGVFKGWSEPAPWDAATTWEPFEVVTQNGSSYFAIAENTNQAPPNATYWRLIASKGDTGATGSTGATGAGYGGTSTTSFAVGTGSKAFTTQAGLAYQVGNYVRASSAAGGANFMEGAVTAYSGTTLTINITKTGGSGTHTDWNFAVSGVPGAGDLLSTNNLSDVTSAATALSNLGGAAKSANLSDIANAATARTNLGMSTEVGKIELWPTTTLQPGRLKANGATALRATYPALLAYLIASGTATFTNGSANVGMTAHNRSPGDPIKLFTSASLPTNFTAGTHGLPTVGTNYFVKTVVDANTVTLATTVGGTAIVAGSAGSGTHTWVNAPFGDGDGTTTFTVPDLRGNFVRGWNDDASIDANRTIGDIQTDAMQSHVHATSVGTNTGTLGVIGGTGTFWYTGTASDTGVPKTDGVNGTPRVAAETRPRNVSVMATIRYSA